MKKYSFKVDEQDEHTRLDSYLSNLFDGYSRSKIQQMIKKGDVFISGEVKKPSYSLKAGDSIDISISEENPDLIKPENIALDIVYEDDNMLVVNKPSGVLTHPTTIEKSGTLVNALLFKYGENLSDINGDFRRGILHRLDRNTSGLLMVAKNNKSHEFLANQIKEKTAIRKYLTIVKGKIQNDEGIINKPIGRHLTQPHKMAVLDSSQKGAKPSITEYRVIEKFQEFTYIELTLKTGRTHQIRVHMSNSKHPIFNDSLYGGGKTKVKTQEQVLQAYKLSFTKPESNDIIELEIKPDEEIQKVLNYLRKTR